MENRLGRQGVHNDIDPKLGVVLGQKAFISEIIVPLAAVILVAVQNPDAIANDYSFEVIMHQVIAPAV